MSEKAIRFGEWQWSKSTQQWKRDVEKQVKDFQNPDILVWVRGGTEIHTDPHYSKTRPVRIPTQKPVVDPITFKTKWVSVRREGKGNDEGN